MDYTYRKVFHVYNVIDSGYSSENIVNINISNLFILMHKYIFHGHTSLPFTNISYYIIISLINQVFCHLLRSPERFLEQLIDKRFDVFDVLQYPMFQT